MGPHQPTPTAAPWCRQPPSSLWVQVRPSQPSRQMQEKESPLPTQVPPFTQGLGRQLLFLAAKESEKESRKRRKSSHLSQAGAPTPGLGPHGTGTPWRLTDSARAALPARGAGAAEGVPAVVARAAVAARVGVALELTCRHTATQRLPGAAGGTLADMHPEWQGVVGTHASGKSCPSSHRRTRSRSR